MGATLAYAWKDALSQAPSIRNVAQPSIRSQASGWRDAISILGTENRPPALDTGRDASDDVALGGRGLHRFASIKELKWLVHWRML
jgi:hypothetical protein